MRIRDSYGLEWCADIAAYSDEYTYIDSDDECVHDIDSGYYYYCDMCERWVSDYYWDHEYDVCTDCAEEHFNGGGLIAEWHDNKGNYIYHGTNRERLGIELEIDKGNNKGLCAADVMNILGHDHVFLENDGSLSSYGFEIITQPHDIETFEQLDFARVMNKCKEYGYKSHDAGNCGLHIHFSKEWFGNTYDEQLENIGIMTRFYKKNFDLLAKLSRRTSFNYCEPIENINNLSLENVIARKKSGTRYTCINLTNLDSYGTVEFRLGRGTLNIDTFNAWIDIHCAIAKASKTAENYDFLNWINPNTVKPETWQWIKDRTKNDFLDYGLQHWAYIEMEYNKEVA